MNEAWTKWVRIAYPGGQFDALDEEGNKVRTLRFMNEEEAIRQKERAIKAGAHTAEVREIVISIGSSSKQVRYEVYPSCGNQIGNLLLD